MPILKLHLENIGPFDNLELDLTDGKGKAHLGPHILAGVNGSGKTTVLRAIAWHLSRKGSGFDEELWAEFLGRRENCASKLIVGRSIAAGLTQGLFAGSPIDHHLNPELIDRDLGPVAAYAPRPVLRKIPQPPTGYQSGPRPNWLSFEQSVSNENVQGFWIHSFLREAVLKNGDRSLAGVNALRRVISETLGSQFKPEISVQESFAQPIVRFRDIELNFSQLAAGFSATLGWVVDFLLRREAFPWTGSQSAAEGPGLILIDEIETHLHPQWQRRILNGIRAAFPNTQIIVTTHSPFVVSSCPEARVHVLKLDVQGKAHLAEPIDHPEGASVATTIRSVFDIASQYGPEIEGMLREWNELKKRDHVGRLTTKEKAVLKTRTKELAKRGEELALLVHEPVLSDPLIEELIGAISKRR